jgi:zinc protease
MNLREDKHWSYGTYTRIVDTIGPGIFRAGGGVQTDKTAESMVEIRRELRDVLAARKPTAAELKFAQDTIVIALPGSNETSTEIAGSYEEILTYGLKDTYWNDLVGDVGKLTLADLEGASARLIHPDALTWIVVGDLAKTEKSIRALGFGEVTVLDADGKVVSR